MVHGNPQKGHKIYQWRYCQDPELMKQLKQGEAYVIENAQKIYWSGQQMPEEHKWTLESL